MKKRMDKFGQGLSTTTLVLLILAAIVLIVVVLGFTKGWGYVFDKIGLLPGNLEAAAQSCGISASSNLKTSYCNEFKELKISGKKQWINCDTLEGYADFVALNGECDSVVVGNLAKQLCENENLADDDLVNAVSCANWKA